MKKLNTVQRVALFRLQRFAPAMAGGWVRARSGEGTTLCALVDRGLAERKVYKRGEINKNGAVMFRATWKGTP